MELKEVLLNNLICENSHEKLMELDKNNILKNIIPKVEDMKAVGECKYHVVNCFEHSINALEEFENILKDKEFFSSHLRIIVEEYLSTTTSNKVSKLLLLKLGIFLHDIGKPACKTIDEYGRTHFHGHEIAGANQVKNLGESLNFTDDSIDILCKYVRYHMTLLSLYKENNMIEKDLYNLFSIVNDEIIGIIILGYADIVSTRKLLNPNEETKVIKTYMEYILTNYIYRYKRSLDSN